MKEIKNSGFLARVHVPEQSPWIPEFVDEIIQDEKNDDKKILINEVLDYTQKYQIGNYKGIIILENKDEFNDFIKTFVIYPYLFCYRDIYIFLLDSSVVINLSHHLGISFYTDDSVMLGKLIDFCKKNGLDVIQRPHN